MAERLSARELLDRITEGAQVGNVRSDDRAASWSGRRLNRVHVVDLGSRFGFMIDYNPGGQEGSVHIGFGQDPAGAITEIRRRMGWQR